MKQKETKKVAELVGKPISKKIDNLTKQIIEDGEKTRKEYSDKISDIKNVVDFIVDDLSLKEKKEIYDLNSIVSIYSLEETERRFLVELLYTIANDLDNINTYQRNYLKSVQRYLEVYDIQTMIDISYIENIENISVQKAILQTLMEFMFLKDNNFCFLNEYNYIFENFSVNNNSIEKIKQLIMNIYMIIGEKGLSEKYGYTDEGINEIILNKNLIVEEENDKLFLNNIINIKNTIVCRGTLKFKNCQIYSDAFFESYMFDCQKGELIFENCDITFNSQNGSNFINIKNSNIRFDHCNIDIHQGLIKGELEQNISNVLFDSCEFNLIEDNLINVKFLKNLEIKNCKFFSYNQNLRIRDKQSTLENELILGNYIRILVESTEFNGIVNGILCLKNFCGNLNIHNSRFNECMYILNGHANLMIKNSIFNKCINMIMFSEDMCKCNLKIENCNFLECFGMLSVNKLYMKKCNFDYGIPNIEIRGNENKCFITNCNFKNWNLKNTYEKYSQNNKYIILSELDTRDIIFKNGFAYLMGLGSEVQIISSNFIDLNLNDFSYLIKCSAKDGNATIEKCVFENYVLKTEVLDKEYESVLIIDNDDYFDYTKHSLVGGIFLGAIYYHVTKSKEPKVEYHKTNYKIIDCKGLN